MRRRHIASVGAALAAVAVALTLAVGWASPALGTAPSAGVAGGDEWPMFMGGFTHAGASQAVGPSSSAKRWTLEHLTGYSELGNSPVVGSDGTIYFLENKEPLSSESVLLRAISPTTHKTLWSWSGAGRTAVSIPAVALDGTVYVAMDGTGDRSPALYAVEKGTKLWKDPRSTFHSTHCYGQPTIGPDGTVYLECSSALYALNPQNGDVDWSFAGSAVSPWTGTPAMSPDGTTLYLTSAGGDLDALSAGPSGGQLDWTHRLQAEPGADFFNAPAVGPHGTIYVTTGGPDGSSPGYIDAVDPSGTPKWASVSNGAFETTPAVSAAGQVVAGNDLGTVVAVRQSDGTSAWSYAAPGPYPNNGFYMGSPASDASGNVYVQNGYSVSALSPDGSVLWVVNYRTEQGASPALDDSGTLYVTGSFPGSSPSMTAYESSRSSRR